MLSTDRTFLQKKGARPQDACGCVFPETHAMIYIRRVQVLIDECVTVCVSVCEYSDLKQHVRGKSRHVSGKIKTCVWHKSFDVQDTVVSFSCIDSIDCSLQKIQHLCQQ